MTRKHYQMVANRVKEARKLHSESIVEGAALATFIKLIARDFARDNPAFSYDRFIAACSNNP